MTATVACGFLCLEERGICSKVESFLIKDVAALFLKSTFKSS